MGTETSEINVEEIMEQIRENIKERGYDKIPLSFEDIKISEPVMRGTVKYDPNSFNKEMSYLNNNWNNDWNIPVSGGGMRAKFKKVVRKLTRFIVAPIVSFQNEYNASNVRLLMQMSGYITEMEAYKLRIEELEKQVAELQKEKEAK